MNVTAMRFDELEAWVMEQGGDWPSPAIVKAIENANYADHVCDDVQHAVDEALDAIGCSRLLADAHWEPEMLWYHVWVGGEILASEITDPVWMREILPTLGTHHHFRDLGRSKIRVKVREPIHDLRINIDSSTLFPFYDEVEIEDWKPNDGLHSSIRSYFERLSERLEEVATEEHDRRMYHYMKDLWFDHGGNLCSEDGETTFTPACAGQLDLLRSTT